MRKGNTEKGSTIRLGAGFVLRLIAKALAFVIWAALKLVAGLFRIIIGTLENYLDL